VSSRGGPSGYCLAFIRLPALAELFEQFLVRLIVWRRTRLLGGIQSVKNRTKNLLQPISELRPKTRFVEAKAQASGVDFGAGHVFSGKSAPPATREPGSSLLRRGREEVFARQARTKKL